VRKLPIYEYRCEKCAKKFEILVFKSKFFPTCPECGSKKVTKLASVFRRIKTEEERLDEFDEKDIYSEDFYKDPRNIGLSAKKRLREMGVDLGDKFEETVERARQGDLLDEEEI
jgi:putative FmdB family regulatory protein